MDWKPKYTYSAGTRDQTGEGLKIGEEPLRHLFPHKHLVYYKSLVRRILPLHVSPLPEYPALQLQVKLPAIFVHAALSSQL